MGASYSDSGVSIDAGNNFVKKIGPVVKKTFDSRVLTGIGGFGALYSGAFPGMKDPVLVSGTDGVGTKLRIAQMMDKHDTIGVDAVAMCVNDILVSGAKPLFFLDYIACGKVREDVLVDVVRGIADGCLLAGCSLVGGETAEHPGVMAEDDYDIAGFSVGVVDREKIIDGTKIVPGDVILGLPSSGVHSNGFSLVRHIVFTLKNYALDTQIADLGKTIGEALLVPTRIYCKSVMTAIESGADVKGMVHITGGGFYENVPRILPDNCAAMFDRAAVDVLPIFNFLQSEGNVSDREMFTTYNMGVGLMLIVPKEKADEAIKQLNAQNENPSVIGEITAFKNDRVTIA